MEEKTRAAVTWPRLRVADWSSTRDTLHMWTQIIGKVRLAHAPLINHWWQVPLYVSPRGLTTSAIPSGSRVFDIEFDFLDHQLRIRASDGPTREVALKAMPVADFYAQTMDALAGLGITTHIQSHPNEVEPAIPFAEDTRHASYDGEAARLFWRQLIQVDRVFHLFRSYFAGKVSPVHFFWGSFDLACTRFSGRTAPVYRGQAPNVATWVMAESYSRELSSCGFWPDGSAEGTFYSYAYPEPNGFAEYPVGPDGAFYSEQYKEFMLPYETVRTSDDPDRRLLEFLQTTYTAAAEPGHWDRGVLETDPTRWERERGATSGFPA
ncbi:DUF5996 family protein [Actinopolymorpha alba]|uniref:DUF5996 family protein n=1 Tax=Actinopolymorpha alba TaxID=533267 RepID=UPI00037CAC83|nr:DUF5996 family protein [Actinopolymorpha alba]